MAVQARSIVRSTQRSFAAMLAWAAITGMVSLFAVNSLVSTLRSQATQAERESALLTELQPLLNEAEGSAFDLIDGGASSVEWFREVQGEVDGALAHAGEVLDGEREQHELARLRDQVHATFAPLHDLAAAPGLTDDVTEAGADPDELRDHVGTAGEQMRTALYDLDRAVRASARHRLDEGEAAQRRLTVALGCLFATSFASTILFARRTRRDLVEPVRSLNGSARHFAEGDLDHRSDVDHPEEFARLAETLNAMAATLRTRQRSLHEQASSDALTGLLNRRGFLDRLAAVDEDDRPAGVLFVDLDRFKDVNDTLGHAAGDLLLQEVARRIAGAVRASDTVGRLGGDEFAVLLGGPVDRSTAEATADRIGAALASPVLLGTSRCDVGASIGIALRDGGEVGAAELLRRADLAMYDVKRRHVGAGVPTPVV